MSLRIINAVTVDRSGERRGAVTVRDGAFAFDTLPVDHVIDAGGLTLMPALTDTHCHLRDPGFPLKETMETGMRAALAGGYGTLCAMANTKPVIETADGVLTNLRKADGLGLCRLVQAAAAGEGLKDSVPTDRAALARVTRVLSNDGNTVFSDAFMRRLLADSRDLGFVISTHCQPERSTVARDLELLAAVGGQLHIGHISHRETAGMVREAKKSGLAVTCEVTPHHLFGWDLAYRVNPPIRTRQDVDALIEAAADGTIDCLATDHAPHTPEDKAAGMAGISNIEHALGIFLRVFTDNKIPLPRLSEMGSWATSRLLGLGAGEILAGEPADFILIDRGREWTIDAENMVSRSANTPFHGRSVLGKVLLTAVGGRILYDNRPSL